MNKTDELTLAAVEYLRGDARRIQHFLKVHAYAALMGRMEKIGERQRLLLEAAAILHDIGIPAAEKKYGSSAGQYQEKEGPPIARAILKKLAFLSDEIDRICFLIGHHHTYSAIDGIDYQILVEADFLVNMEEEHYAPVKIKTVLHRIFKTAAGKRLCAEIFGLK